jgi:hypothetical protein
MGVCGHASAKVVPSSLRGDDFLLWDRCTVLLKNVQQDEQVC